MNVSFRCAGAHCRTGRPNAPCISWCKFRLFGDGSVKNGHVVMIHLLVEAEGRDNSISKCICH